ncbi:MAG: peroxiredoxin [Cyclonatronaceae bacterium]
MPLEPGKTAPDFTLPDSYGTHHSLDDLLQNGPLVLFFYPKDDSPGCTKQACSFRDSYERLLKTGATVAGISRDSVDSHRAFQEKYELPFLLLSDEDGSAHQAYRTSVLGLMTRRITYLINPDKKIQMAFEQNLKMGSHVEAVLEKLMH